MYLCDINTCVERGDIIGTLECLKLFDKFEKFKEFTGKCQNRCFLALQQLQRRKVKPFYFI